MHFVQCPLSFSQVDAPQHSLQWRLALLWSQIDNFQNSSHPRGPLIHMFVHEALWRKGSSSETVCRQLGGLK
eukprot:3638001-Rhodomonas_salina.2